MMRATILAIGVLLLYAVAIPAHATTITVTNTNDSGPGSLRQALRDANDGDTINFAVTGTVTLTSGGLPINKNITISGPGADQLSIDGNQTILVFGVFSGNAATICGLTVRNAQFGVLNEGTLTVSNSAVSGNSEVGLFNEGVLTASNCVISDNSGDGLYNGHAILNVSDCIINGNSYSGIYNYNSHGPSSSVKHGNDRRDASKIDGPSPGDLTIANSIISDNSEHGIYNDGGYVTILNSRLTGNSDGQDSGGGAIKSGSFKTPGSVTVFNSTISGNSASGDGGGIYADYTGVTVVNSTISGNSAEYIGGGISSGWGVMIVNSTISGNSTGDPDYGYGGGVHSPTVTITNSTVSGNSAATCGGICGETIEIGNTILNANAAGSIDGSVTSRGYNVCSDDAGGLLNGPGDQINTDPLLGPLRNHGGPTLTHVPMRGSPAIDAGDPNTPPPDHDQRGACFLRVFGPRIDVGSVETQPRPQCVTPAPRPTP
jgi:predicted outer membrane repeat protein